MDEWRCTFGNVRLAIRKSNCLLRIHNNRSNDHSWENYRKQRNLSTKLIRSAKQCIYDKINKDLSSPSINVKKWWSISKNLCGRTNNSRIPTILENYVLINNPKQKAFTVFVKNMRKSRLCKTLQFFIRKWFFLQISIGIQTREFNCQSTVVLCTPDLLCF